MPILSNPAKALLQQDLVAFGMLVRVGRSGDIARIAKTSGHHFIMIDTPHSLFDVETIGHIVQTALAIDIAPLVRVSSWGDPNTSVLLDNCVSGIAFPDISAADQPRRAVARAKFPPVGRRSVGSGYPMFDFQPINAAETVPPIQEDTLVVCMVENEEGLPTWKRSAPSTAST